MTQPVERYKPEQRKQIRELFHTLINRLTDEELELFRQDLNRVLERKMMEGVEK